MRLGTMLGALALAGSVLAAPIVVHTDERLDSLHAERLALDARFRVAQVELVAIAADMRALGTSNAPIEITEATSPANTPLRAGHWAYVATLRERGPASVLAGRFVVRLTVQGAALVEVHLQQALANPAAPEGARVVFDIGPDEPAGALFVLEVLEAEGPSIITLTSVVDPAAQPDLFAWEDEAGAHNPTLRGMAGETMRFRIANGDGAADHNLRIRQGATVLASSADVSPGGEPVRLDWTPEEAGTYRYDCRYHSSMNGTIEVSP